MVINRSSLWINVYGPEEDAAAAAAAEAEKKAKEEQQLQDRKFSQSDVDRFLAEDRRKTKAQTEKLITELEALKQNKNLSEKQRNELSARIEELHTQVLTKDQLLEKERTKMQTEHRTELQKERDEKEAWKQRYTESSIVRNISDVAVTEGAYSPEQIVSLLQAQTRLVEDTDADGTPTGTFTPKVKFKDTDAEGKSVTLELTIQEAVKRMKDLPDRFGNLFKANLNGGLGGNGTVPAGGTIDPSKIKNMSDYQRMRERVTGKKPRKSQA